MKLGNSSRAMGVGAYFLKVFFSGWGKLLVWACSEEWASRSALVWQSWLTIVNNALGLSERVPFIGVRASCNLICLLRVADLLSLTSCVRTYEWLLIRHWANDAIFSPSSGGWFEERRGASRVVTNPTVWVRDRRVSIIDYGYRWRVSGIEFLSLMFATNGGFVRFDNVVNRIETFERETTYE